MSHLQMEVNLQVSNVLLEFYFLFCEQIQRLLFSRNQDISRNQSAPSKIQFNGKINESQITDKLSNP